MHYTVCQSCRSVLRLRLQQKIFRLRNARRERSTTSSTSKPLDSWYWDTLPPNPRQLAAADWFFANHNAQKLWTASEWQAQRHNEYTSPVLTPEVAFLGRSNVGKSSLLNALLNEPDLNKVGPKPGKTKVIHAYSLAAEDPSKRTAKRASNKLYTPAKTGRAGSMFSNLVTVLDAPGYGFGSRSDWGQEVIKYLSQRKHLRRAFVLIDAMHGLKHTDIQMLDLLRAQAISYQVIATKCDRLEPASKRQELLIKSMEAIQQAVQPQDPHKAFVGLGEILNVGSLGDGKSNASIRPERMQGITAVRWAVLRAAGLEEYALSRFNELPRAAEYDDSPTQPNATRKIANVEVSTPEESWDPAPSINMPAPPDCMENFPDAMLTSFTSSQGIDALLAAVDDQKSKRNQRVATPNLMKDASKPQHQVTAGTQDYQLSEASTVNIQALLATSRESKSKRSVAGFSKRKKSKHSNPFAGPGARSVVTMN